MLYATKYVFSIPILFGLCLIAACKSEDEGDTIPKTEEELQLEKLSKTWIPGFIQRDGVDVTGEFSGFTLTFTQNKTYTAVNGGEVFPASGTWEFATGNLNRMVRDDGVVMEVVVTATTLNLQFQIDSPGGRFAGTSGDFEFDLITQ